MIELSLRCRRGGFELALAADLASSGVGVFGRSGAGKTTLLLALAGLIPSRELRLRIDDRVVVDTAAGHVPPPHRRGIGLVFQDHRLFPHRSVAGNLRYGRRAAEGDGPGFAEVVEMLGLDELLERRPADCSAGQRQRVALGRALLAQPRLLLLDEPLAHLDRELRCQILPFLRRVRARVAIPIITVSHQLEDLLTLGDDLLLIEDGRCAGHGRIDELTREATCLELLHDCGVLQRLPGRVAQRDPDGLCWVAPDGATTARIAVGDCPAPPGEAVEIVMRPADLALARGPITAEMSFSNRIAGRVAHITRGRQRCLVQIDAGYASYLLAEVTGRAVDRLALAPGDPVTVLCKAQALRARALETPRTGASSGSSPTPGGNASECPPSS